MQYPSIFPVFCFHYVMRDVKIVVMKPSTTPVPSVKEALSQGMDVCLPNILDDYLHFANQGIASDAVITHLSYEVATEHDISATQAEDVIYYTLGKLGVEL